ncbi:MAG: aminoacyl-tRNA hydrolase [Planctomycetota bacterium]
MKLVVGLGNPGAQYERTRHNAGFMVVDELVRRHAAGGVVRGRFHAQTLDAIIPSGGGDKVILMKPTTYMNRSGLSVGEAVHFFKLDPTEDLLVITDDVAIPVGSIRVRASGGSGGQNGLKDIDRALGFSGRESNYPRVRVGIGANPRVMRLDDWVLSKFGEQEMGDVNASITEAADAIEMILGRGIDAAMNRFNKKVRAEAPPTHPSQERPADDDETDPGWASG